MIDYCIEVKKIIYRQDSTQYIISFKVSVNHIVELGVIFCMMDTDVNTDAPQLIINVIIQ